MKDKIKKWYRQGLWTEAMVQNAVKKGVLTTEEAEEILLGGQASIREQYPDEEGGGVQKGAGCVQAV